MPDTEYREVTNSSFGDDMLKAGVEGGAQVGGEWSQWSDYRTFELLPSGEPQEEPYPSRAEVLAYLDGKTIRSPKSAQPEISLTLKKDQIETLVVSQSRISGGELWSTPVQFIVVTEKHRYAVEARVSHNWIEGKRVFYGIEIQQFAKQ